MVVAWAIPDVPRKLSDRIKREDFLIQETIIKSVGREQEQSRHFSKNSENDIRQRKVNGDNIANSKL